MAKRRPGAFRYVSTSIDKLRSTVQKARRSGRRNYAAEYALRMRAASGTSQERRGHGPTTKTKEKRAVREPRRTTFAAAAIYNTRAPAGRAIRHRERYGRAQNYLEYDLRGLSDRGKAQAVSRARSTLQRWIAKQRRAGKRVSFYLVYRSAKYIHPKTGRMVTREVKERFGDGWELAHSGADLDYRLDEIADRFDGSIEKIYIGVL